MDTVVHMDLDTFYVEAERLRDSQLKGKPVLVGGLSARSVVASCSREARRFGVHSGMPTREALRLCPEAIVRRGDMDYYSGLSRTVTEIIAESAPLFEKASIDEHYLDLSGMEKHFGAFKWAHQLRGRITQHTGLPISFGLSANKTVSKIATTMAKLSSGELAVDQGKEKPFLAPLSVGRIPGVGRQLQLDLAYKGVSKISTLQQLPSDLMEMAHGKIGLQVWRKGQGIDPSPVTPYTEQKSMSRERTFMADTTSQAVLKKKLMDMICDLGYELRAAGKMTGCITIKIRYSNFDTHTKQTVIPYSSLDDMLITKALALFEKTYSRRLLVRLLGVKFSNLVAGSYQIDLFTDSQEAVSLYKSLDGIRSRYGYKSILRAAIL